LRNTFASASPAATLESVASGARTAPLRASTASATPYERSLDVHISHLRKKIEQEGPQLIRAVRGTGYVFSPGQE